MDAKQEGKHLVEGRLDAFGQVATARGRTLASPPEAATVPGVDEALRGRVIDGKYRLTRPLGEGGMGMVWVATHTALGREFAVKLLRPEFARDPQALIRFQQEAVAVGKVGSPHLTALTDFGTTADGEPYIVMELLEGRTLEEAMRAEKPMAVPRIADICCQILTALAAVHERGIVHRDLKPANVFLTRLGEREDFVKLLDFGVAKVLGGDRISHFTRTGVLLGTPTYMSPEQVQGSRGVDHRCDLWAVGVILFRALTGRRPHDAASRGERLAAIATQDVPPLRRFRPDLGEDLEAVLARALTRDLGRRYATALEFRAALEPFRGGIPSAYATSLVPPPPAPRQPPLAAAPAGPRAEGRPTVPAVGNDAAAAPPAEIRPTVPAVADGRATAASALPASGERPAASPAGDGATRRDGAAAESGGGEPKEFRLEPTVASGLPAPPGVSFAPVAGPSAAPGGPTAAPPAVASAPGSVPPAESSSGAPAEPSRLPTADGSAAGAVEPSGTAGSGEVSMTAAGLRRRPGAAIAIASVVVLLFAASALWLANRSTGDGSPKGADGTTSPAAAAAAAHGRGTQGMDVAQTATAPADAGATASTLEPGLRERYVRVQAQITCWQYYRKHGHAKSPAWEAWRDLPEACLREGMSLRDWRRVLDTLPPEDLLAAASEATQAAVPCIAEASGLSPGQVPGAVPAVPEERAGTPESPPPTPSPIPAPTPPHHRMPSRDGGTAEDRDGTVADAAEEAATEVSTEGGATSAAVVPDAGAPEEAMPQEGTRGSE